MKTFEYVAWDHSGNCKEGVRQAPSQDELLTFLRSEELTPAVINEVVGTQSKKTDQIRYKKVKSMDLATFCWQLNTMLSGGLSITLAIQTIADEIANPYFEYILKKMSMRGRIKTASGGSKILQELSFAENSNAGWYSGYDLLPVGVSDVISAARGLAA